MYIWQFFQASSAQMVSFSKYIYLDRLAQNLVY